MFTKSGATDKIKIFLAEDDTLIRNSVQKSICWGEEGFEFVGSAADGELAYPAILDTKPDILITDIKMPFVDGFELSQMVKREFPNIKILILTGYTDFDMAKAAIKTGASEYLIKPVSSSKLLKTLHGMAAQIRTAREEKKRFATHLKPEEISGRCYEEMQLFSELIAGGRPFSHLLEMGKKSGINLSAQNYKICLFDMKSCVKEPENERQKAEAVKRMKNLEHMIPGTYCFWRAEEGWAWLIMAEDGRRMNMKEDELTDRLRAIMDDYSALWYFGAMGSTVSRLRELGTSFEDARRVFAGRFDRKESGIEMSCDLPEKGKAENAGTHGWGAIWDAREAVEKFLSSGTKEKISDFTKEYFDSISADSMSSSMIRRYIILDIFISVMAFEQRTQGDGSRPDDRKEFREAIYTIRTREEARLYMETLLGEALYIRDHSETGRYSNIISRSKEIISLNYMKKLSLDSVAEQVGMSPSYFSFIFSKETGQTFVAYLTDVRIEKAKELLESSSMKTSEIGFEVGYKEPHYFCSVFKKSVGCSPKEYRSRQKRKFSGATAAI